MYIILTKFQAWVSKNAIIQNTYAEAYGLYDGIFMKAYQEGANRWISVDVCSVTNGAITLSVSSNDNTDRLVQFEIWAVKIG